MALSGPEGAGPGHERRDGLREEAGLWVQTLGVPFRLRAFSPGKQRAVEQGLREGKGVLGSRPCRVHLSHGQNGQRRVSAAGLLKPRPGAGRGAAGGGAGPRAGEDRTGVWRAAAVGSEVWGDGGRVAEPGGRCWRWPAAEL